MLGAVLLAAVVSRCLFLDQVAIEHFDEGVYASNIWFDADEEHQYPLRFYYAPPFLPACIEACLVGEYMFTGGPFAPSSFAAILPNLVAGPLTVLGLWFLCRRWLGNATALAAGTVAVFSEPHILYTRTALTDAMLLCCFVWGLHLLLRALDRGGVYTIPAAACVIGLGWWTKYNGWLPLFLGGVTIVTVALLTRQAKPLRGRLLRWLVVAGMTFGVWVPFLLSIQTKGGYQGVMENHRQYVVGLAGWLESFWQQWSNLSYLSGPMTSLGLGLASGFLVLRAKQQAWWAALSFAGGVFLVAQLLGSFNTLAVLGLAGAVCVGLDRSRWESLGSMLCLAWFAVLLAMTPFYTSYPRLTLPFLAATWPLSVVALEQAVARSQTWELSKAVVLGGGLALALLVTLLGDWRLPAYQSRQGLEQAASRIRADLGAEGEQAVVLLYGEPALFWHLRANGLTTFAAFPLEGPLPEFPPTAQLFVLSGLHANRDVAFQEWCRENVHRLEEVRTYDYLPSDLVLLNQHSPQEIQGDLKRVVKMTLYRFHPQSPFNALAP